MSFMKPFTYRGEYVSVHTHMGTYIVPMDACGNTDPDNLIQFLPEGMGPLDSSDIIEATIHEGWYGRMSAPGYMDCTDWESADTEESLLASLEENYGPFDDDECEDS